MMNSLATSTTGTPGTLLRSRVASRGGSSLRNASSARRAATPAGIVRAVQTPLKPSTPTTPTTPDKFPKSTVKSRQTILPATETFKQKYADYSTGYASVPGLSYERSEWITEVEGEIPAELEGTLLRNGPAMYVRGDFTKSYLDGDGMVTSIALKARPSEMPPLRALPVPAFQHCLT